MDITIREAQLDEAAELTRIAIAAKSHWGYTAEQIEGWRSFLTITTDYIQDNQVWVVVVADQIAGFAAIEQHDDETILEHFWVLPAYIGKGIGKRLFLYVADQFSEFVITADPNADGFYYKMGAQKIGDYPSMLQNRTLTQFKYTSATE